MKAREKIRRRIEYAMRHSGYTSPTPRDVIAWLFLQLSWTVRGSVSPLPALLAFGTLAVIGHAHDWRF